MLEIQNIDLMKHLGFGPHNDDTPDSDWRSTTGIVVDVTTMSVPLMIDRLLQVLRWLSSEIECA
jgi:hypothetical protein